VEGTTLTSQGERWLEPARRMAEWAGELSRASEHAESSPSGIVRIAAPPGIAYDFVAPFARLVRERYPHIELQTLARVEYADLARREADIALRGRAPTQRDLTVVYALSHLTDVFVSKSYAKQLPARPRLADLSFIAWAPPFDALPPNPQLRAAIPDFRAGFAADDYIVQLRAAEAGVGAVVMPKVKHRFNQSSPLVPLGLDLGQHGKGQLLVVCAKSALGVARVRAVAELLKEELVYAERLSAEAFGPVP